MLITFRSSSSRRACARARARGCSLFQSSWFSSSNRTSRSPEPGDTTSASAVLPREPNQTFESVLPLKGAKSHLIILKSFWLIITHLNFLSASFAPFHHYFYMIFRILLFGSLLFGRIGPDFQLKTCSGVIFLFFIIVVKSVSSLFALNILIFKNVPLIQPKLARIVGSDSKYT